jgi:hypothetical protein
VFTFVRIMLEWYHNQMKEIKMFTFTTEITSKTPTSLIKRFATEHNCKLSKIIKSETVNICTFTSNSSDCLDELIDQLSN